MTDWIGKTETRADVGRAWAGGGVIGDARSRGSAAAAGRSIAAAVALAVFPGPAPGLGAGSRWPRAARRVAAAGSAAAAHVGREPVRVSSSLARRRPDDARDSRHRHQRKVGAQRAAGVRRRAARNFEWRRSWRWRRSTISSIGITGRGLPRRRRPPNAAWERTIQADDVLLFRYSALTFNAHRIHYDRRYATEVEGYPGLVVHGPLIATLLMDLLRRHQPDSERRAIQLPRSQSAVRHGAVRGLREAGREYDSACGRKTPQGISRCRRKR